MPSKLMQFADEQIENNSKLCVNCQHYYNEKCNKGFIDKPTNPLSSCKEFLASVITQTKENTLKAIRNKYKDEIYQALLVKDKNLATEKIVDLFKKEKAVISIRSDDKDEIWIYNDGIYEPNGRSYIKEFTREICGKAYTTHFANVIIEKIQTDSFMDQECFFGSPTQFKHIIPLLNGLLNLRTRELEPYTPSKVFFAKVPIKYQPQTKPQQTISFFKEILEDIEDIKIIQEWFGYCLYKDYQVEKSFMLFGKGRNGKGQLLELLKRFVGFNIDEETLEKLKKFILWELVE